MDEIKYTISFLNSKWELIKNPTQLSILPRKDELIYLNNQYFEVLNVIHMINQKQNIFVVIKEMQNKFNVQTIENQEIKK